MVNSEAKLDPKIFDKDAVKKPTRDGYGEGLVSAGEANENVVALCADLLESTRTDLFAQKFPDRFFELGVAEQNMVTVAAGLGISGKIPFAASFATFSPGRNWEQIRTTIAYNDANVKIAGHHTGISTGPDGATHQATEDIAMMRVLPNMKVFVPCDAIEARKATIAAAQIWGPAYLRFSREKTPVMTTDETPYVPGKAQIFWQPGNGGRNAKAEVLIIGCGPMLYSALVAARELEEEKINVIVMNCHTIKPLDEKTIVPLVKKIGAVVTVEDHQASGGLGGAVAELLAKHCPAPMESIGLQDTFGESGPAPLLLEKYGMGVAAIKRAVKAASKRKK